MRYVVLGSTGLIGQALSARLELDGQSVLRLSRPEFDITKPDTYSDLNLSGAYVLDCLACIDGSPEEIRSVNVDGLASFLRHCAAQAPARYVYVSTSTTLSPEHVNANLYVRSKHEGEKMVLGNDWGKVIRLTFPFGEGESQNRLISRLIQKADAGEEILVDDIFLPLTPLSLLEDNLESLLHGDERELNPTDGKLYHLSDVVEAVFAGLAITANYTLGSSRKSNLNIPFPDVYPCTVNPLQAIKTMAAQRKGLARSNGLNGRKQV